jgi:hypothetical protein
MTALHTLQCIADLVLTLPLQPARHSFPRRSGRQICHMLPTWIGGVARSLPIDLAVRLGSAWTSPGGGPAVAQVLAVLCGLAYRLKAEGEDESF